jgi:hypothetical protein
MLGYAIDATREVAMGDSDAPSALAALRNQEVQALTLIALELRELRGLVEGLHGNRA